MATSKTNKFSPSKLNRVLSKITEEGLEEARDSILTGRMTSENKRD